MNITFILLLVILSFISEYSINCLKVNNDKANNFGENIWKEAPNITCSKSTENRLDSFIAKIVDRRFPTTRNQLRQFCNAISRNINFVVGFSKSCLDEFGKKLVQVMFYPMWNEFAIICKPGRLSKKAEELLSAAKCGNAARAGIRKCYFQFNDKLMATIKVPVKSRIPSGCCHFQVLRECLKSEAEEEKTCTRHNIDYVERYALEIFGSLLRLTCYDYMDPNSDVCDRLVAQTPNLNETGLKKPKSFLTPMLRIMESLGENEKKI